MEKLDNMCECKVVIVGDKGVGKSALVRRFTAGQFEEVNITSCERMKTNGVISDTST